MKQANLFIISAPSGAGKTSLVKHLCETLERVTVSISHTTRAPRHGEVHTRDYYFVDMDEYSAMLQANAFLEHARVFDHCYGTARANVESYLAQGSDVILEIDWQGAQQVRKQIPECISIFILPPSLQVLERRLNQRGTDDTRIIARRMRDAITEISHYAEYDYLIVNDNFEAAAMQLRSIVIASRLRRQRQVFQLEPLLGDLLHSSAPVQS